MALFAGGDAEDASGDVPHVFLRQWQQSDLASLIALNSDQVELALAAWRTYGKGNHPAGLNIGDCCAYALAKYAGEPLLFKGKDFSQTDIRPVIER